MTFPIRSHEEQMIEAERLKLRVAAISAYGNLLFQKLSLYKMEWADSVSKEIREKYDKLLNEIDEIKRITD